MERRVLISYASEDPDWAPEQVEAVAVAIEQTGLRVHLDRWHQRDRKRRLSLAEWQAWMDASIDGATHIICLVSPRYRELWSRKPGVPGGYGVAFESIRLIHHLYLLKQHNDGRILTLRPDGHGYDGIPRDLALDCPDYYWASHRDILLSHLGEAELPEQVGVISAAVPTPTATPTTLPPMGLQSALFVESTPATPATSWVADRATLLSHLAEMKFSVGKAPYDRSPEVRMAPSPPAASSAAILPPAQVALTSSPIAQPSPSWASDSGEDRHGRWADLTVDGVTQRMRWIPPTGPEGFEMGDEEEGRRREVVAAGFWLADTPCTQAFWQAVTGSNPSHFKTGADAPQRPVENVSWDAVMDQFIARLAARPGWAQDERVCLPSEVEWEYAARAGTTRAYWWGDEWDAQRGNVDDTGLRDLDDAEGTSPVKRYRPNPWGLFDMHGNVWEWCEDVWCERRDAPEARPDADERVVRGGSWFNHSGRARAAYRGWRRRGRAFLIQGFRFALRSPAGPEAR
jgi:formylglycine-generating enzyme required for sulfatase activity